MSSGARRAVLVTLVVIEPSGGTRGAFRGSGGVGKVTGEAIGTCFGLIGHQRKFVAGCTRVAIGAHRSSNDNPVLAR